MATYEYQAKQGPEKTIHGFIEAPNESAAIEKISQLGLVPISIHASTGRKVAKKTVHREEKHDEEEAPESRMPVFRLRSGGRTRVYFFSAHLARLIKAGVPIVRAIHLLASNEKDPSMRAALESMEGALNQGKSLSGAMEQHPELFPRLFCAAISAGEVSGGLEESLARMAVYFRKQDELRSKIQRALAYPMVLAVAGVLSIFFILTFLVPRLQTVFAGMGDNLPLATRIVLFAGMALNRFWIPIVVVVVVLSVAGARIFKGRFAQSARDAFKLRIFFIGNLIKKAEFARFSRTLALCFANGLPFLKALYTAIPTVENAVIRQTLEECAHEVEKGGSFGQAMKKHALFSGMAANLISVGEESGNVEETLVEIAELYEQETDDQLVYVTTLLEPLMILFVGAVIGFIVIAVLLPIFDISSTF